MRMLIFDWVEMGCDFWRSFVLLSCDLAVKKKTESFVRCRFYVDAVSLQKRFANRIPILEDAWTWTFRFRTSRHID